MNDDETMDNWKQFQGTELGGLLGQIYGNKNKPKINYPKPVRRKSFDAPKTFIPGGAKSDANDPRKATRRSVSVAVPKVASRKGNSSYKPIDFIERRKSAEVIKTEIEDIQLKQSRYRPAYIQPISADAEKDRLNQIFTFKGGKGLPDELTHPIGVAPFEIAEKRKNDERNRALQMKRAGGKQKVQSSPAVMSEGEQLAEQIRSEIDERTQHLQEMRSLGAISQQQEKILKSDIARKVQELERINY